MDHFGGPAVLGGIITGLMLWAWALGRWQGSFPAAPTRAYGEEPLLHDLHAAFGEAADPESLSQQAAREERLASLGDGTSLGQIHAEVSAYRQATQVLTHLEAEDMPLRYSTGDRAGAACRNPDVSGKSTCRLTDPANEHRVCEICDVDTPELTIRIDQPSAEASAFTRV